MATTGAAQTNDFPDKPGAPEPVRGRPVPQTFQLKRAHHTKTFQLKRLSCFRTRNAWQARRRLAG